MKSYEVLRQAADRIGVKVLAGKLRLSPALVYKWCQEAEAVTGEPSGALNPLDRVAEIVEATGDADVVNWLCHQSDGFFVRNPKAPASHADTELLMNTQRLVHEFGQLLVTVTKSIEDDGAVKPHEAERIRRAWELLKRSAEAFTVACERGHYDRK